MSGMRIPLRAVALAVSSFLMLSGCADNGGGEGPVGAYADRTGPTVIGTDRSAESRVVAALYGELLTAAGVRVRTASTAYAFPADTARAVVAGRLGLAPEYETTLLRALGAGQIMPGHMAATLSMALPPGVVALPPSSAERGFVLAVTRATAHRYGLRSLSDLAGAGGRPTLGGAASRVAAAPSVRSLREVYGVSLASAGTSMTADVLVLRSTDPAIVRDGLVVLTDPSGVLSPEHVFPLIAAPDADLTARKALARVNTLLTTAVLAKLAASVDKGEAPAAAARSWLRTEGLVG
ncbi:glycine betaine ABC transporter substrate-binding protein [Streptomyces sp. NPDC051985]|uniref:glycine betaine ABC transporter substrate-binding protein n=1 Tax=Streptomyces sp. NPDC051985 TaxID=3155807 RepID=UPI00342135AD